MTTVLQVTDLQKSFGGVVAASNINISIDELEIIGIIGANGAGKTTFVNMVTGYMPPTSGSIAFMGQSILGLRPEVKEFRKRGATQLSGGQQKFVAFARAIMCGTKLLLLDEPSEGIAPIFAHRMIEIMADLKKQGESVLVAESNDTHISPLLDATFVIERGSIVAN